MGVAAYMCASDADRWTESYGLGAWQLGVCGGNLGLRGLLRRGTASDGYGQEERRWGSVGTRWETIFRDDGRFSVDALGLCIR